MRDLRADAALPAAEKLRAGITALIDIGRSQPHLYKLMFNNPSSDPTAPARAAEPSQTEFSPSRPTWSASRTPGSTPPCSSAPRTESPAWR
ncbi:hypothetical protein [Streptomyces sp. NRRL B-24085]|uniref:hypothetical protein n=1 Tax=Streptomyces sp. NRRL B-24085 TaxID=1709476 RepID=UPI0006B2F0C4|nr:hypothetical protein [Streptomyces sp. NRRL B-24085]